jgi:hypothetical protein
MPAKSCNRDRPISSRQQQTPTEKHRNMMKIAELESSIGKNNDVLCSKSNPNWAINNPYLEILAPRFFSGDRVLDWSDLPKRVSSYS